MRVLGLSGSLRADSHNTRLLRAAAPLLPPGAQLVLYEGLREIPPFDDDVRRGQPRPGAVRALEDAVRGADAVLVATPEYNHSIPGQLKNAMDWLSRPLQTSALRHKPVAVVGASAGLFGAVWAQAELRKVLATIGAHVVDAELPVPQAHEAFTPEGALAEAELSEMLSALLADLVAAAGAGREPMAA
ncbi:MAG: NAD(P)H-dependent oxidoreductase [Solirubrobacterales bacterium]|nr:NAD(P)H-dependent oxidoreductase [Solirubrobacterales bacterium]